MSSPAGSGAEPQPSTILMHFRLKRKHLVLFKSFKMGLHGMGKLLVIRGPTALNFAEFAPEQLSLLRLWQNRFTCRSQL